MRYTERFDVITAVDKDGNETHHKGVEIEDKTNGYEKFAQLEDIEEELGIELIKLFEVLKQKAIFIPCVYDLNNNLVDVSQVRVIGINQNGIIYENFGGCYMTMRIKDYGKSWALTKEELL